MNGEPRAHIAPRYVVHEAGLSNKRGQHPDATANRISSVLNADGRCGGQPVLRALPDQRRQSCGRWRSSDFSPYAR